MFLRDGFTRRQLIKLQQLVENVHLLSCPERSPAPSPPQDPEQGSSAYQTVKLMLRMDQSQLAEEAEQCRLQALTYLGTREASFLLRVAREFDDLAKVASEAAALHALASGQLKLPIALNSSQARSSSIRSPNLTRYAERS